MMKVWGKPFQKLVESDRRMSDVTNDDSSSCDDGTVAKQAR